MIPESGTIVIQLVNIGAQHTRTAISNCRLILKHKLPVIFHNLRGYDSHFIMQKIGKIIKEKQLDINCIPNNMEKYMAFMLGKHIVFIDSMKFMATSLDNFKKNLPEEAF